MTNDNEFQPDECEVIRSADGSEVKIAFRQDSGMTREVVLPRKWLPSLVAQLLAQIEPGSAVPIDKNSFRPGQTIVVQGHGIRNLPNGGVHLTVYAALPEQNDRVVTIPLEFSNVEVGQLVKDLTRQRPTAI